MKLSVTEKGKAMKVGSRIRHTLVRIAPPVLLTLVCSGEALGAYPCSGSACVMDVPCSSTLPYSYSHQVNTAVGLPAKTLEASGPSTVSWTPTVPATGGCTAGTVTTTTAPFSCAGLTVTVPTGTVTASTKITITAATNPNSTGSAKLDLKATNPPIPSQNCTGNFTFKVTLNGGGWGDPHLTTVDGVHYDFQSAGEFTALREEGLVIQTRQTPVPTATVPITNPYTGITHCVAIYTAVAAKLGSTRVTLQPSPGAEPNPKSMELRVNGKLVELGEAPMILYAPGGDAARGGTVDGTLTKHADGLIEITDATGTQLVVTSNYWDSRKVWYLNVNVYGTSAHEGTMGSIAQQSWLPALPDGSSVGAKPASASDRYKVLYEKFADAWRVTDATSLFDYAPGTSTATFTRDEWPRNSPDSCAIEGQTSAVAVTDQVAQQACANVTNATDKADCVFDVKITGNQGFAKSYETMRSFTPRGPGWYTPVPPKAPQTTPCPPSTTTPCPPPAKPWWCWIAIVLAVLAAILAFLLFRKKQ